MEKSTLTFDFALISILYFLNRHCENNRQYITYEKLRSIKTL